MISHLDSRPISHQTREADHLKLRSDNHAASQELRSRPVEATLVNLVLPSKKNDMEAAYRLVEAGYPAVKPVLSELVEWLQDYNWPVAHVFAPFLAKIGKPMIPYIDHVFRTDDMVWKYWMISCLISKNDELFEHYREMLIQCAEHPSPAEKAEELDDVARDALASRGFYSDTKTP